MTACQVSSETDTETEVSAEGGHSSGTGETQLHRKIPARTGTMAMPPARREGDREAIPRLARRAAFLLCLAPFRQGLSLDDILATIADPVAIRERRSNPGPKH